MQKLKILYPKQMILHNTYRKALERELNKTNKSKIKTLFLCIKFINTLDITNRHYNSKQTNNYKKIIKLALQILSELSPKEIMQYFPIAKTYTNKKYIKDYFYSLQNIKKYEIEKPLGNNLKNFIYEYWNEDIILFQINIYILNNTNNILASVLKDKNIEVEYFTPKLVSPI